MYNATLYINTGYNAINIPDSVNLLENLSVQKITVPALDIYQCRELSSFVVKANYSQIRNADYLRLVNTEDSTDFAFYSIQNITMTSMDTALLSVTMDYYLTVVGTTGPTALQFTDGICERHHVPKASDTFGAYCEEDPYMSPSEMMLIETQKPHFLDENNDVVTLIESTVDLIYMYNQVQIHGNLDGMDYESGAGNIVCVPQIESVSVPTVVMMENETNTPYETTTPNAAFYTVQQNGSIPTYVPKALSYVRSLGIESCILAQYNVPEFMVDPPSNEPPHVSYLTGKRKTSSLSNLPFIRSYNSTIRNMKLFYGENVKYNIVSLASGNRASFLPEEIYDNNTAPTLEMRVDPRPKGAPYFRFETYRGISGSELFFTNAVKGLEWQNAPLVYEGASGSLLNQYAFNAKRAMADETALYGAQNILKNRLEADVNLVSSLAGNLAVGVGGFATGNGAAVGSAIGGVIDSTINYGMAEMQYQLDRDHAIRSFNIEKNTEMQALLIQNQVVAPSMNFPISEGIRDFVGNTCLVYRTVYTNNDAARIDKILTMYGYKHTVPIETSFFTNRPKFNYIQASGIAIKNPGVPKWLRDGLAAQFSVGMRIWHVAPDTNAYTDGTNE